MSNTWINPTLIAQYALATLWDEMQMLPLVSRDFSNEVQAGAGATITYRKEPTLTASTYSSAVGVQSQNLTETSDTIVLNQHKYVSLKVTDLETTLDIDDYQRRVIRPAMMPLAAAVDTAILALRSDITQSVLASAYDASTNPHPGFDLINARRVLTTAKVPKTDRACVVDEYIGAQWLRDDLFNRTDARGARGTSALAEGDVGRVFGFDTYETGHIDDFTGVAFHRSAFEVVFAPLALPKGAVRAEYMNFQGLPIRVVYSYDATYLTDVITFDLLFGTKTTDATRAVLINGLADSV